MFRSMKNLNQVVSQQRWIITIVAVKSQYTITVLQICWDFQTSTPLYSLKYAALIYIPQHFSTAHIIWDTRDALLNCTLSSRESTELEESPKSLQAF